MAGTKIPMLFMTIEEFKKRVNLPIDGKLRLIRNPNIDPVDNVRKLFIETPIGKFKTQQSIDPKLPMRFMYQSEALFADGCLVNVTNPDANVVAEF